MAFYLTDGGRLSLGSVTEAKWHLLSTIAQSLLLIDRIKNFKIYEPEIVRTGPGRPTYL